MKAKEVNKGQRLYYFLINKQPKNIVVKESDMSEKDKYNSSDHIPIFFTYNLNKKLYFIIFLKVFYTEGKKYTINL